MYKYLLALFFLFSCSNPDKSINYDITHVTIKGVPFLKVGLTFDPSSSGVTWLEFPDQAWGEDSLHNSIERITLLEEGKITIKRDSGLVVFEYPQNIEEIHIEYYLKHDTDSIIRTRNIYRPIIKPNYFQVFGHNLFMLPITCEDEESFDVKINWHLPEEMVVQNSFGHTPNQEIQDITVDEFKTSIFVGGDFRRYDINIEDNNVALALRGDWEVFEDSTMVALLEQTIRAQRDFWRDHSEPYFSVTMIPTIQERGSSFQGTGLTRSFATAASNNKYLEVEGLVYLLNHELQHNWTGLKIKNENEEQQYWFSEGFTDYYTWKNIASNKIYDLDANFFISELNKAIKALYTSKVANAPNSEINYENFWADPAYGKLPYRRGAIFAFYLDNMIKKDSNGKYCLDDLMRDFLAHSDKRISHPFFVEMANNYVTEDIEPFFNKHIQDGALFDLRKLFSDFGLDYHEQAEVFEIGFDWDQNLLVTNVQKGSNAEKAGIRAGDLVVDYSFEYERPDIQGSVRIERNGKEIDLQFYPSKTGDFPILKETAKNSGLLGF